MHPVLAVGVHGHPPTLPFRLDNYSHSVFEPTGHRFSLQASLPPSPSPMGGGWLRWAALGGPLLAATVAIPNTTFTGNATPTVCYLPDQRVAVCGGGGWAREGVLTGC